MTDEVLAGVGCSFDNGLEALVSKLRAVHSSDGDRAHQYRSSRDADALEPTSGPTVQMVSCLPGCRAACSSLAMQPTLALNLQARLFLSLGPPSTGSE